MLTEIVFNNGINSFVVGVLVFIIGMWYMGRR